MMTIVMLFCVQRLQDLLLSSALPCRFSLVLFVNGSCPICIYLSSFLVQCLYYESLHTVWNDAGTSFILILF